MMSGGSQLGKTTKFSSKNGSYKIKSPYTNTKRKTFNFNGGGISSMHEVMGNNGSSRSKDLFESRVYNKKKGRSTYSKLHLKNSRKSAKG